MDLLDVIESRFRRVGKGTDYYGRLYVPRELEGEEVGYISREGGLLLVLRRPQLL